MAAGAGVYPKGNAYPIKQLAMNSAVAGQWKVVCLCLGTVQGT